MSIDLGSPAAGNIAQLTASIAAVLGLLFAGFEVRRSYQDRRSERERRIREIQEFREGLARAVGVKAALTQYSATESQFDFELLNAGQYPIEHVDLRVGDVDADALNVAAFSEAAEWQESLGSAFPGAILKRRVRVPVPATDSIRGYPVVVLFTDTWDQRWAKVVDGDLVKIGSPGGRAENT